MTFKWTGDYNPDSIRLMIYKKEDLQLMESAEIVISVKKDDIQNFVESLPENYVIFYPSEDEKNMFKIYGITAEESMHYSKYHEVELVKRNGFIIGRYHKYFDFKLFIPDHPIYKNSLYNYYYKEVAQYIIKGRK